jgi:hypothetical protein
MVHHTMDVMHVEKNGCEALVGTLLDIPGKTKDTIKARMDLEEIKFATSEVNNFQQLDTP